MAVSNQLRTTNKVIKTPGTRPALGDAKFTAPDSGLNRIGVSSAIALKSKKVKNLKLAGNY